MLWNYTLFMLINNIYVHIEIQKTVLHTWIIFYEHGG